MIQSPLVGISSLRLIIAIFSHHPIVIVATRMMTLFHLMNPRTTSHTTHLKALERRIRREIHIQTGIYRQTFRKHFLHNSDNPILQRSKIGILIAKQYVEGSLDLLVAESWLWL